MSLKRDFTLDEIAELNQGLKIPQVVHIRRLIVEQAQGVIREVNKRENISLLADHSDRISTLVGDLVENIRMYQRVQV